MADKSDTDRDGVDEEYLQALENERSSLGDPFNHAVNLLEKEIERVKSGKKEGDSNDSKTKQQSGEHPHLDVTSDKYQKVTEKVAIPIDRWPKMGFYGEGQMREVMGGQFAPGARFPQVNFVGKLLGPKGSTMKQLQEETMTRISVYGRGSIRDKEKEEELRKEGGKFAHLNEKLHVHIEAYAEPSEAHSRIAHALAELKKFLIPTEEEIHGGGGPPAQFDRGQMKDARGGPFENGRGRGRGRGGLLGSDPVRAAPSRGGMERGRGAPRGVIRGRGGAERSYDDGYGRGASAYGGEEYDEVPKRTTGYEEPIGDDGYGYGGSGGAGSGGGYTSGRTNREGYGMSSAPSGDRGSGYGGAGEEYGRGAGYGDATYADESYGSTRSSGGRQEWGDDSYSGRGQSSYGAPRSTSTPAVRGRGGATRGASDEYGKSRSDEGGRGGSSYSGVRGGGSYRARGSDVRAHPYTR